VRAERVFQHLEKPEAALREMVRVTKVGGRILLMDPDHGQANLAVDDAGERRVFEALRRALLRAIINPHSGVRLRPMVQRAGLGAIQHRIQTLELAYPDFGRAYFLNDLDRFGRGRR
jgi:SAM-dependent methyltransferase